MAKLKTSKYRVLSRDRQAPYKSCTKDNVKKGVHPDFLSFLDRNIESCLYFQNPGLFLFEDPEKLCKNCSQGGHV